MFSSLFERRTPRILSSSKIEASLTPETGLEAVVRIELQWHSTSAILWKTRVISRTVTEGGVNLKADKSKYASISRSREREDSVRSYAC